MAPRAQHGREDIDRGGLGVGIWARALIQIAEPIANLNPRADEARIRRRALEEHVVGKSLWREGAEAQIVLARHDDIDVVVPGDETSVPHGPEESARVQPIAQAVLLAYRMEGPEDAQEYELELSELALAAQPVVWDNRS